MVLCIDLMKKIAEFILKNYMIELNIHRTEAAGKELQLIFQKS